MEDNNPTSTEASPGSDRSTPARSARSTGGAVHGGTEVPAPGDEVDGVLDGVLDGGTGSSDRGVDGGTAGVSPPGPDDTGGAGGAGGTVAPEETGGAGETPALEVPAGGAAVSEVDDSSSTSEGTSFRAAALGFTPDADTRTVSVTVDTATRVCVAIRAARTSRAFPSATTVSVTVEVVSNGSVHHCDVDRVGGGAARGASSGDPVSAINANMPPSARNGTTTTAPKHPRPLRGSSR